MYLFGVYIYIYTHRKRYEEDMKFGGAAQLMVDKPDMKVSCHGGTPIAGRFIIMDNPIRMYDLEGYPIYETST